MPPVDLDKAAARKPWDFTVTIGGVVYATRQPTFGEEKRLRTRGALTDVECVELIWSLFKQPGPPLADATHDIVLAFYGELLKYKAARTAATLSPLVKSVETLRTSVDKLRAAANTAAKSARGNGAGRRDSVN
jgi:hypothetical protein